MAEDWRKQSERSTPFMLRTIVFLAKHVPRSLVRLLLYPIVLYFMLTGGSSRAASKQYLRRALDREPTWGDGWRHFFAFASCTLDRVFLLGNNYSSIRVDVTRSAGVLETVSSGQGCLLVVAHFGSTEVLRFSPPPRNEAANAEQVSDFVKRRATHIKTTILLDRRHGRMLMQFLEQLNPAMALDVVDASERGPALVLKLKEALQAGRMVCVMADRAVDDEGFAIVDFLGGRARFSVSPWVLASALRAPVILGFGIYANGGYRSHFELFADRVDLPRDARTEALDAIAQRYANRLEHYVRSAPYNWFNFYEYWLSSELNTGMNDAATH